jgi:hypothetical protein
MERRVSPARLSSRGTPFSGVPYVFVCAALLAGCGREAGDTTNGASSRTSETTVQANVLQRQRADAADWSDPSRDGWDSEVLAARFAEQLARLAELIVEPQTPGLEEWLNEGVAQDFACAELWPPMEVVFEDSALSVARSQAIEAASVQHGASALLAAVEVLRAAWGEAHEAKVKLKVIGMDAPAATMTTQVSFEAFGKSAAGLFEQSARWTCEWAVADGRAILTKIAAADQELVVTRSVPAGLFVDCTGSVLAHEPAFQNQLRHGRDHWARHVETVQGLDLGRHTGLAVGDADGDGLDDVYLCQAAGLPNLLFLQNADGSVRDASALAGVDWLDHTSSALFIDLDNDGDQDLALATRIGLLLLRNEGGARFERVATKAMVGDELYGLSAVDYDSDGDLDLYVLVQRSAERRNLPRFSYIDANNGGGNRLYRNDTADGGKWVLTDVTAAVGLDVNNRRFSLAAAWEDYDADGDQDLYVANDFGQNCLYRNDDGQFVDVAPELGVVDFGSGMAVTWGDYDHDGRSDLYVANMFSSAGSRIATQADFRRGVDELTRARYARFAKGNSLYRQTEAGTFEDVGEAAGVEMGRWAWGSAFVDINNDSWEDLLVANGFITTEDSGDL